MKRITFWFLSTLSVVGLLFGYDGSTSATTTSAATPPAVISGSTTKARTVSGKVASTQWGPVQVALTISGSKITKVTVLQHPSGTPKHDEINNYALPILTREATSAQSAKIDMVSGATVTSAGYIQSLQSAIDQASL